MTLFSAHFSLTPRRYIFVIRKDARYVVAASVSHCASQEIKSSWALICFSNLDITLISLMQGLPWCHERTQLERSTVSGWYHPTSDSCDDSFDDSGQAFKQTTITSRLDAKEKCTISVDTASCLQHLPNLSYVRVFFTNSTSIRNAISQSTFDCVGETWTVWKVNNGVPLPLSDGPWLCAEKISDSLNRRFRMKPGSGMRSLARIVVMAIMASFDHAWLESTTLASEADLFSILVSTYDTSQRTACCIQRATRT